MDDLKLTESVKAVFTSEYLSVYVIPEEKQLYADWSGVLDAAKARAGCTAVLKCLQEYPCSKVLNNNSKVTGHYPGALDWVGTVWFPSMFALGVKWFAWVYSSDFYTQINTDHVIRLSSQVQIETFYDLDAAQQWIAAFGLNDLN
ncbi:hypothetical protein [uncultured Pontibacter sp.]|uniref:hypothetical protein n=1 Tax=uncultured Pontibacter sp. TaxID=453356 RepID=UPI002623AC10|nr:hypothetical protein [uncultured Pontibacter sp.]